MNRPVTKAQIARAIEDSRQGMEAFDAFPPEIREILNYCPIGFGLRPDMTLPPAEILKANIRVMSATRTIRTYGPDHPNVKDFPEWLRGASPASKGSGAHAPRDLRLGQVRRYRQG